MAERPNKFFIGVRGDQYGPLAPIQWPLSADDALLLAAWLVAMAEPLATESFETILKEVQNG